VNLIYGRPLYIFLFRKKIQEHPSRRFSSYFRLRDLYQSTEFELVQVVDESLLTKNML